MVGVPFDLEQIPSRHRQLIDVFHDLPRLGANGLPVGVAIDKTVDLSQTVACGQAVQEIQERLLAFSDTDRVDSRNGPKGVLGAVGEVRSSHDEERVRRGPADLADGLDSRQAVDRGRAGTDHVGLAGGDPLSDGLGLADQDPFHAGNVVPGLSRDGPEIGQARRGHGLGDRLAVEPRTGDQTYLHAVPDAFSKGRNQS